MTDQSNNKKPAATLSKDHTNNLNAADLRRQAEERVGHGESKELESMSHDEARQVIHELQVHQKMEEEALKKSEERFSTIFTSSSVSMAIASLKNNQIVAVNDAWTKVTGFSREETVGRTTTELNVWANPGDRDRFISRLSEEGSVTDFDAPTRHKSGNVLDILISARIIDFAGEKYLLVQGYDISELKQMEEALRINEQRYRMAQAISHSGNWEYNLQTTHFWSSDEAKRIYGFDPDQADFTTDEVENCIPERERVHQALVDLVESGKPYNLEFEVHPRNSSEPRFISSVAELKQDKHGNPIVIGTIQDITARKRVEDLLKKREQEYRTLAEHAPDFFTRFDTECRQIYISPSVSKAFGIPEEAFLGKTHLDPTMPGDPLNKEAMYQAVKRALQFGEPFISELKWSTEKGETFIETHIVPEYDEAGKITSVLGIARDITKRKRAEDSLRESEEKYRTVLENITDAILLAAPDGRVFAANQGACEMLRMSESEIIASGRNGIADINDPRLPAALKERAQTGRFRGEVNFKKKDGTVFPVWMSSTIFKDSHGDERACILAHDVSEQKKHEKEIIRFQKLESLGLFAGGIAHDFNNILTTILGNVSLAGMLVTPEDEIHELLKETEKASIRAQMLTQQLLTFAKGGNPIKEIASISDIIKESSLFVLRGLKFRCEFSIRDDLWSAEIDVGQISQVINNIVLNARQAMPEGGIIRIAADNLIIADSSDLPLKPGKYIRISIADQGHGIAEKHLLKIFDPYFTTKQQGSGLGLAVTYSVIKKHDGYISVKSAMRVGTTFFIYLPASDKTVSKKEDECPVSGQGRILIMDDEVSVREVVRKILEMLGYESDFATNGAEAVLLFKEAKDSGEPYDTVILDLTVPGGMGGKDAIEKLLEIDPEVKAIVSSGYSDDPVLSNFKDYGFKAVLPKPFESRSLSKVLDQVLKEKD